jgi:hypothetical protein
MSKPILHLKHTLNFVPGDTFDTGRPVKRLNAQVVAITIFENTLLGEDLTYREGFFRLTHDVEEWALRPGRASVRRAFFRDAITKGENWSLHRYRMPMEFIKERVERLPVDWVPLNWVGSPSKMHLDDRVFEETAVVLARLSADEVVPVLYGVAHYPWDPNKGAAVPHTRMVYGYWTSR